MEKTFGIIQKGRVAQIRTQIRQITPFTNRPPMDVIDVRQFYDINSKIPDAPEDYQPTKSGISLSTRQLPELITHLTDALNDARKEGLLDSDNGSVRVTSDKKKANAA